MMKRPILLTPGPVNVHPTVVQAVVDLGGLHHRSHDFRNLLEKIYALLRSSLEVPNDFELGLLSTSGTGALEGLIKCCYRVADACAEKSAIVFVRGHFGKRLERQVFEAGFKVHTIEVEDDGVFLEELSEIVLLDPSIKFAFTVHHETSLGCLVPFDEIYRKLKSHGVFLCVDMISSLGAELIDFEGAESCDAFVSVSGKAIGAFPGVGIVGLSKALSKLVLALEGTHSALCLVSAINAFKKFQETPFTPAVPIFVSLYAALEMLKSESLAMKSQRHYQDTLALEMISSEWNFIPIKSSHLSSTTRTFPILKREFEFSYFQRFLQSCGFGIYQNPNYNRDYFQLSAMGWFQQPLNEMFCSKSKNHDIYSEF
jgi:2-aminoethylphosphonate-pyruvate transaminase